MIALDTNILVRFLVEDDPEQTGRARALLAKTVESGDRCFVSDIVLCELVWVLERSYKTAREEIARVLGRLLRARHLAFVSVEELSRALEAYGAGRGGFSDYVIREHATANGCDALATFDRVLLPEPVFFAPP
jgi:predicted nucleic-acid-binding protein